MAAPHPPDGPVAASSLALDAVLDSLEPVTVTTPDGRVVYINQAGLQAAGFTSVEQLLAAGADGGFADTVVFDEDGLPFPDDETPEELVRQGLTDRAETVLRRQQDDGSRWVLSQAEAIRDEQGRLRWVLSTQRDITASHERERQLQALAQTLQDSILSAPLPDIAGVQLGVEFVPRGGEFHAVGGDFYEVFALDDEQWLVLAGDVCGKGPEAAAVTSACRHTLRALALHEQSPSVLLSDLNEMLLRYHGHNGRFATLAVARMHVTDNGATLTLALGGHPQPLLRRADGSVQAVGRPGMLVGAFKVEDFSEEQLVSLNPGDTLVMYTDGITEARNPDGDMFDLGAWLENCPSMPAQGLAGAVKAAVVAYQAGAQQRDDIAVLVLRVPDRPVLHERLPAEPASVPALRRLLETLASSRPALPWDRIYLAASELVTNSVKYAVADETGGRWVDVTVTELSGGTLRVVVSDPGERFVPDIANSAPTATSGRGMFMVGALSSRWGHGTATDPACFWFETDPEPAGGTA